jgi:hypothetical protein
MTHEHVMTHKALMSHRADPDPRDPDPQCPGECEYVSGGFWEGVRWEIYVCRQCHTPIAAVEGGVHWWNHVISPDSHERLGVDEERQISKARRRDQQRADELGSYTPVEQVLDMAAEREQIWGMMVQLAQDVAQERRFVTCRCLVEHDPDCPVRLAQQIVARLQEF